MLEVNKDLKNLEGIDTESEQIVTESNYNYNPIFVDDRLRQSINYFRKPPYYTKQK